MELKLDKLVKIEKKENSKMRGIAKVLIDGCINKETRKLFEDLILDAYNNMEE